MEVIELQDRQIRLAALHTGMCQEVIADELEGPTPAVSKGSGNLPAFLDCSFGFGSARGVPSP